jgi:hypothetical protein
VLLELHDLVDFKYILTYKEHLNGPFVPIYPDAITSTVASGTPTAPSGPLAPCFPCASQTLSFHSASLAPSAPKAPNSLVAPSASSAPKAFNNTIAPGLIQQWLLVHLRLLVLQ